MVVREYAAGRAQRERILESIPQLEDELGYSPTVREIAVRTQMSKSGAYAHLRKLAEAGKVMRPSRAGAGWRIA